MAHIVHQPKCTNVLPPNVRHVSPVPWQDSVCVIAVVLEEVRCVCWDCCGGNVVLLYIVSCAAFDWLNWGAWEQTTTMTCDYEAMNLWHLHIDRTHPQLPDVSERIGDRIPQHDCHGDISREEHTHTHAHTHTHTHTHTHCGLSDIVVTFSGLMWPPQRMSRLWNMYNVWPPERDMLALSISQFNPLPPVYYWSWVMEGINPFNLKPKDLNATEAYTHICSSTAPHQLLWAPPPTSPSYVFIHRRRTGGWGLKIFNQ